jgi:hypothetical protein
MSSTGAILPGRGRFVEPGKTSAAGVRAVRDLRQGRVDGNRRRCTLTPVQIPSWLPRWPDVMYGALLVALSLWPALWAGDVQWVNDEPMLIARALEANQNRQPAGHGLPGTAGTVYGPLPIWIYQLFLWFSNDLILLVEVRAVLFTGVLAIALLGLVKTLGLWRWLAPLALLSPYGWLYSRILWDNTFCIPFGALGLAAYLRFCAKPATGSLFLAAACLACLPFIHLMSLPMLAAVILHGLLFQRRELWRHAPAVLIPIVVAGVLGWPYLVRLFTESAPRALSAAGWNAWLFPARGGLILSGAGLSEVFGGGVFWDIGWASRLVALCISVSALAYAAVWLGLAVAAGRIVSGPRPGPPLFHAAFVAGAAWLGQVFLNGLSGKYGHTHYFNGTWIVYILLAWLAADRLARRRWGKILLAAYASSLAAVLVFCVVRVHVNGGGRTHHGPTLANQILVARTLNRYPAASPVELETPLTRRFPHALAVLRAMQPVRARPNDPPRALRVVFATTDPADGRIKVERRPGRRTPDPAAAGREEAQSPVSPER